MKKLSFTLMFVCFSLMLFAQEFEVPANYELKKAEDYTKYEQDVIKCVNWLLATPVNEQTAKRKQANAFLLQWISGSPDVHIEIKPGIVTFMESPDLLMIFMGGWTKYTIESKDNKDKVAGSLAGIKSVIELYTNNKGAIKKDKNVEKYIKMKEKGTLEDYVKKNA